MKESERASINPQAGAFFRIENGGDMHAEFAVHGPPLSMVDCSRQFARPEQCVLLWDLFRCATCRVVSEFYFSGLRVQDYTIVLTLVEVEHVVERPGDGVE